MSDDDRSEDPTVPGVQMTRRPRLTPSSEARLKPIDDASRESYEAAERALELKAAVGVQLDELLAELSPEDGAPAMVLEIGESTVHAISAITKRRDP